MFYHGSYKGWSYDRHIINDVAQMKYPDEVVPRTIRLSNAVMPGDSIDLGYAAGTIVQFYTGNKFNHYVCVLDFEEWTGNERCPRFAYYRHINSDDVKKLTTWELVALGSEFDWSYVRFDVQPD